MSESDVFCEKCGQGINYPPAPRFCSECAPSVKGERLTDARLAEIEARASAATVGPWAARKTDHNAPWFIEAGLTEDDDEGALVAEVFGNYGGALEATATFVAAARQDVPALCAEVRALREESRANAEAITLWQGRHDAQAARAERLEAACAERGAMPDCPNCAAMREALLRLDSLYREDQDFGERSDGRPEWLSVALSSDAGKAMLAEREAYRNLLAVLNADGGHRQREVGTVKVAEEAEAKHFALLAQVEAGRALAEAVKNWRDHEGPCSMPTLRESRIATTLAAWERATAQNG